MLEVVHGLQIVFSNRTYQMNQKKVSSGLTTSILIKEHKGWISHLRSRPGLKPGFPKLSKPGFGRPGFEPGLGPLPHL